MKWRNNRWTVMLLMWWDSAAASPFTQTRYYIQIYSTQNVIYFKWILILDTAGQLHLNKQHSRLTEQYSCHTSATQRKTSYIMRWRDTCFANNYLVYKCSKLGGTIIFFPPAWSWLYRLFSCQTLARSRIERPACLSVSSFISFSPPGLSVPVSFFLQCDSLIHLSAWRTVLT